MCCRCTGIGEGALVGGGAGKTNPGSNAGHHRPPQLTSALMHDAPVEELCLWAGSSLGRWQRCMEEAAEETRSETIVVC